MWLFKKTKFYGCLVSIHTPTWGVTARSPITIQMLQFQSTHLHEVWLLVLDWIHILVISFNPHTYMRCDIHNSLSLSIKESFNPHTYMRCDFSTVANCINLSCFNPHTYMRCDQKARGWLVRMEVSIHTPTWGVTKTHNYSDVAEVVSIHTPTWGVTRALISLCSKYSVSIHTPTWGVTQ